jgi:3-hydroxyisobutyrate dehydrogenase
MSQHIGFIGTGVMGKEIVKHLIQAKHNVTIYNRTLERSKNVAQVLGSGNNNIGKIKIAQDLKSLTESSPDGVFVMVGFPADVESVVLHPRHGVLHYMKPGHLLVDLTTSSPALAKTIFIEAQKKNIHSLDAPVTGGDIGAKNGTLSIMVGGEEDAFKRANVFFPCFGKATLMGKASAGQYTKLANQVTIAGAMIGVVEGLLFAHQTAGIDLKTYVDVISNGGAASKSLSLYAPRILAQDMKPGFFIKHFVKDLGLALDEARRARLALPGLALVAQLYSSLEGCEEGELGTQALIRALDRLSHVQGPWMGNNNNNKL